MYYDQAHWRQIHCGKPPPPDDFADEETVVEDRPRETVLQLIK
jgi:hypothetical protein